MGETFDGVTERLAKFLLTMQRPNGGFFPEFSLDTGEPIDGPDPLYAAGQAVFALTLLEEIVKTQPHAFAFEHGAVRAAVERAMSYYSGAYWDIPAREFFFVEENWHCLAARAALGHHRHDGYERFCLDYVDFKRRLILDEESRVRSDLVGGYGFGNVILPHNTGAAGFGEAFAASMALRRARGEQKQEDRRVLALILGFLLHHQWDSVSCFACAPDHRVVGAFSEHMGSPHIRIDYVQHAMAVLGHGGPLLAEEHDGAR
jgi:hypothetical protein